MLRLNQHFYQEKEFYKYKAIAFDPGIRTFQIGFNSDENFLAYAKGEIKKLFALGKRIDVCSEPIELKEHP
jgi:hypothetical protein